MLKKYVSSDTGDTYRCAKCKIMYLIAYKSPLRIKKIFAYKSYIKYFIQHLSCRTK